jgi:hypothetical protein
MDHGDYFACYEPTPRIEEWAIVGDANPYQAPELRELRITGLVYGHPRFNDGQVVTTSPVRASAGHTVETHNTTYNLGRMSEEYKKWCSSMGIEVDASAPVKVFS